MMLRREFMTRAGLAAALGAAPLLSLAGEADTPAHRKMFFDISLAQWSLNRQLRGGLLKPLDFPKKAREAFGIAAVEYVNHLFPDRTTDQDFLTELKKRADDHGVRSLLIMVDDEGHLGDFDAKARQRAVENHYRWVTAAASLGCHSVRVNVTGEGSPAEVQKAAVEGLISLATFARDYDVNVIVENHIGYAENGQWLSKILADVDMPSCGSLPDFGNFGDYDRYQGVRDLIPFAKGVSAKSYAFDDQGNETTIDFKRMLTIIRDAGFRGHIGVEFEGPGDEDQGVLATKELLQRLGEELS